MTNKACVIGHPISHSLSPKLHTYWLKQYGIDGSYTARDIAPDHLEAGIQQLIAEGFAGFNVTIPHKEKIIPLLDGVDEIAQSIGAVNTVMIRDNKCYGTNTDAYGFIENLRVHVDNLGEYLKTPLILGAGGAARAIVKALADEGIEKIHILARDIKKAESLNTITPNIVLHSWDKAEDVMPRATLLINTTPLGMRGKDAMNLSLESLTKHTLVTDIVYNPLETPLLQQAKKQGNQTVDGMGMLIFQAMPGFEQWFGIQLEVNHSQLNKLKSMLMG